MLSNLYDPVQNEVKRGKVGQTQGKPKIGGPLSFMSMSKEQLQANYTATYINEEKVMSGVTTFHIELSPKSKGSYRSVELWIDVNGMPLQVKMFEHNNDSTTVLLSGVDKNKKLNKQMFEAKYPSKVKKSNF